MIVDGRLGGQRGVVPEHVCAQMMTGSKGDQQKGEAYGAAAAESTIQVQIQEFADENFFDEKRPRNQSFRVGCCQALRSANVSCAEAADGPDG